MPGEQPVPPGQAFFQGVGYAAVGEQEIIDIFALRDMRRNVHHGGLLLLVQRSDLPFAAAFAARPIQHQIRRFSGLNLVGGAADLAHLETKYLLAAQTKIGAQIRRCVQHFPQLPVGH